MHLTPLLMATIEAGQYISAWKVLPVVVILLIWARLLTWMDKDSIDARLPRQMLNTVELGLLIAGFVLFLILPVFFVAFAVLSFCLVIGVALYLILRQQKVGLGDLNRQFSDWLHGIFSRGEKKVEVEEGAVQLINRSGAPIGTPDAESPDLIGYMAVQKILTDPLRRNADTIDLAPSDGQASVRYVVDGVAYNSTTLTKEDAASAVAFLKQTAGMDVSERRRPQHGKMKAIYNGKKKDFEVVTAGSTAGESARIEVNPKQRYELKLDELGFSDEQLEQMTSIATEGEGGIVILSAPKGQGLTSLMYGVLRRHDAFLTHILTVEKDPPVELEGITQNKFGGKEGPTESQQVDWAVSQEPDVMAVPLISDPKAAGGVVRYVENGKETGKRAYVGLRATSTFDALRQWRRLVGDDKAALKNLRLVVNGRLVRKLCMACKVGYTPEPEVLRKLNMQPEKVGKLFQARTEPLRDQRGNPIPCEFCNDLRFVGRTGVFEIFAIDDEVRHALLAGGSDNTLKQLFRKQRRRFLQEEALMKVQAGDTSVQEVLRALKVESTSSGTSGAGGAPAAAPRRPAPTA